MKLSQRLTRRQRAIDRALAIALKPAAGSPAVLQEAMAYCVFSGGKRYRPLLCLAACEAVGGDNRSTLSVACAIEMIHTYSLVHDDLPAMDNADERRGRPSCHRRFGEANAILVGDALLTRAFELLSANGVPNVLAVTREIAKASGPSGLIGGQVLDLRIDALNNSQTNPPTITSLLEDIARRKTAALIAASVVAGALAGNAPPRDVKRLRRYGANLGLAFQLIDDCHDGDGFVRTLGADATRRRANRLIDQAKKAVQPFGNAAALLVELADWLAST